MPPAPSSSIAGYDVIATLTGGDEPVQGRCHAMARQGIEFQRKIIYTSELHGPSLYNNNEARYSLSSLLDQKSLYILRSLLIVLHCRFLQIIV